MVSLRFAYNPPKVVKVIGRAAERRWREKTPLAGVLVRENFQYQLMDAEWMMMVAVTCRDVDTFTKLKLCRILYRQRFKSRVALEGLRSLLALSGRDVQMVRLREICEVERG